MKAFWDRGYVAVAVNDLPQILGASKPTIYAAFTGKDDLYARALEAYGARYILPELDRLDAATDLETGLERWLASSAGRYLGSEGPKGCFVVRSLLDRFDPQGAPATALAETMRQTQARLEDFLARFMPDDSEHVRRLAGYLLTVRNGMAVSAAAGANRDFLDGVIASTVGSLPRAG